MWVTHTQQALHIKCLPAVYLNSFCLCVQAKLAPVLMLYKALRHCLVSEWCYMNKRAFALYCIYAVSDQRGSDVRHVLGSTRLLHSSCCYMSLSHTIWSIHSSTGGQRVLYSPGPELTKMWLDGRAASQSRYSVRRVLEWPLSQRRCWRIGFQIDTSTMETTTQSHCRTLWGHNKVD